MKAQKHISTVPECGVVVELEGPLTRLFFDFSEVEPNEENEEVPEDLKNCESIDVEGRGKGELIAAIVKDHYKDDSRDALNANYNLAKDEESPLTPEKRAEYIAEYNAFQEWRAHAKEIAAIAEQIIAER